MSEFDFTFKHEPHGYSLLLKTNKGLDLKFVVIGDVVVSVMIDDKYEIDINDDTISEMYFKINDEMHTLYYLVIAAQSDYWDLKGEYEKECAEFAEEHRYLSSPYWTGRA